MKGESGRDAPPRPARAAPPAPPAAGGEGPAGSSVGAYLGLGLQFALAIVLFVYLGQWLDRRFGTAPWLLLACVFLGAGGSFYGIYRRLMADLERSEARRRMPPGGGA